MRPEEMKATLQVTPRDRAGRPGRSSSGGVDGRVTKPKSPSPAANAGLDDKKRPSSTGSRRPLKADGPRVTPPPRPSSLLKEGPASQTVEVRPELLPIGELDRPQRLVGDGVGSAMHLLAHFFWAPKGQEVFKGSKPKECIPMNMKMRFIPFQSMVSEEDQHAYMAKLGLDMRNQVAYKVAQIGLSSTREPGAVAWYNPITYVTTESEKVYHVYWMVATTYSQGLMNHLKHTADVKYDRNGIGYKEVDVRVSVYHTLEKPDFTLTDPLGDMLRTNASLTSTVIGGTNHTRYKYDTFWLRDIDLV